MRLKNNGQGVAVSFLMHFIPNFDNILVQGNILPAKKIL